MSDKEFSLPDSPSLPSLPDSQDEIKDNDSMKDEEMILKELTENFNSMLKILAKDDEFEIEDLENDLSEDIFEFGSKGISKLTDSELKEIERLLSKIEKAEEYIDNKPLESYGFETIDDFNKALFNDEIKLDNYDELEIVNLIEKLEEASYEEIEIKISSSSYE